jgi:uncharacterized membrane protein HdeD (DUF308 family)
VPGAGFAGGMTETSVAAAPRGDGAWPEAAADLRSQPFPWWMALVSGLSGVLLGGAVLFWPEASLRVMAALTGVWLLVVGLARIIGAFLPGAGSVGWHVLSGVVGVVILVAGLICLRDLAARLAVLALFFAVTWILSGITEVAAGLHRTGGARVGLLALGVVSLLAGVVFLVVPNLSLAALVLLTGISSLIVGLAEVALALFLRRAPAAGDS